LLSIESQNMTIGISTSPSHMLIETENARVELEYAKPDLNMHTEHVKVEISQVEAFASAGLKTYSMLSREAARRGIEQCLEYIAKTAQDGDRLAAFETGGNPIADISERDAYPEKEFNIVSMPSVGPEINVLPGRVTFDPEPLTRPGVWNGIKTEVFPASQNIVFTPSQVKIFIERYNWLKINYIGEKKIDKII